MQRALREAAARAVEGEKRPATGAAAQPSTFRELQRRAGNRALGRHVALERASRVSRGVRRLQRDIAFGSLAGAVPADPGVGGLGFYRVLTAGANPKIKRPGWTGPWALVTPPATKERNHIVSYLLIAEALRNVAQKIYADAHAYTIAPAGAGGTLKANLESQIASFEALTESLYPGGVPAGEHKAMLAERKALVDEIISAANNHPPSPIAQEWLGLLATLLEARLMSAPENIRLDDATMNKSIGSNIDPQLHNQFATLLPSGAVVNLPPGVSAPPGWAGANANNVMPATHVAVNAPFYTMPKKANDIVYRFITAAQTHVKDKISVARNDQPGNPQPNLNYPAGAPLSSSSQLLLPPHAGTQPVLVFDPDKKALPYQFG